MAANGRTKRISKLSHLTHLKNNPNRHTERGSQLVTDSIQTVGFADSMTVDRDGVVLSGNQRLDSLGEAQLGEPIVVQSDGTRPIIHQRTDLKAGDERAKKLAVLANRTQELNLEWDPEALKALDVDLSQMWTEGELASLFDEDSVERDGRPAFTAEQIQQAILDDFPAPQSGEEVARGIITKAMAMGQFNALCRGSRTGGGYISALFNPHRFEAVCRGKAGFVLACRSEGTFQKECSRFMATERDGLVHPINFVKVAGVGWGGFHIAYEFPPSLARDLYKKYCQKGARVLDPCHGWGGRVIGFLAANLFGHYDGFDPVVRTHSGWQELVRFLQTGAVDSTVEGYCLPFEDAVLEPESYDFAFTSPPYFDTEDYGPDPLNSANRYMTLDDWAAGFVKPLIVNTMAALKQSGRFVLCVGSNRYPLSRMARRICNDVGFYCVSCETPFSDRSGLFGDHDEDWEGEELLLISRTKACA
jgi:hypothetical protein